MINDLIVDWVIDFFVNGVVVSVNDGRWYDSSDHGFIVKFLFTLSNVECFLYIFNYASTMTLLTSSTMTSLIFLL